MATLFELTKEMMSIEDALYENGGELTPELETALVETQESLMAKVDGYNALIRKFGSTKDAISAEIERLTKLKKTVTNAEKNLKERLLYNMNMFGISKLEGNLCKMSSRVGKSLEVDEDALLGPHMLDFDSLQAKLPPYVVISAKVSKTGIKEFEKESGILPAGCQYQETQSLIIK